LAKKGSRKNLKTEKSALVAEGGGMRGVFAAGVLDVFFEEKFDPFNIYIGVSAGACNLSSHLAGQYGRNRRLYTDQMTRDEFISIGKFLAGGHMMDLDWLWDIMAKEEPLDTRGAASNLSRKKKEFIIVATSAATGEPMYLSPGPENMLDFLKASSSVPLLYRGFIEIDSVQATDGGVSDPIPVARAFEMGASRIAVIRTRPSGYVKRPGLETFISSRLLRRHPKLSLAIMKQAGTYGRSVEFIADPPPGVSVIEISPPRKLLSGRTTKDRMLLTADYETGRESGRNAVRTWREIFEQ
jgi:predicted patatin/cPLA2 family phospholipase